MTDSDRLDQTAEDSNEATVQEESTDTLQQPAGRFLPPRNLRAWVAGALALIAIAGGLGALVAAASGRATAPAGSSPSRSPSAAAGEIPGTFPSAQAGSSASKSNSNFPSAAQVAVRGGAISLPAAMQGPVLAWQSGTGGTSLAAVTSLFGTVLQQQSLRQYPQMKYSCALLARSVLTARAGPPIPVAAMQTTYVRALAELASGAADCQAAISVTDVDESFQVHVDAALLDQSASDLAAGSRDIFRSTAEIVIATRTSH